MAKLSPVRRALLIRFFEDHGWTEIPGGRGSHHKLNKPGMPRPVIIPDHREIKVSVVASNLRTAKLTRNDLLGWLGQNDN